MVRTPALQRMATELVGEMLVSEVVPGHRVKDMLEAAKAMNANDACLISQELGIDTAHSAQILKDIQAE